MDAPPSPSLREFGEFVSDLPTQLSLWGSASSDDLWPMLGWLNVWPIQELRSTMADVGPMAAVFLRHAELHNTVGVGVTWLLRYLSDRATPSPSTEDERQMFARTAADHWSMMDLLNGARGGVYAFSSQGHNVHFEFAGDMRLEALDGLLCLVDEMALADSVRAGFEELNIEDTSASLPGVHMHLTTDGIDVPWEEADEALRMRFRRRAGVLVESLHRTDVPEHLLLGDFSFGQALATWRELLSAALYRDACLMLGSTNPLVACPAFSLEDLVAALEITGVARPKIQAVLDFLTFDVQNDTDPCLAPLIPVGDLVAPMSALISPSSPERNLLAKLRTDTARFGPIGEALGRIGEATVSKALESVPNVLVASQVKVYDHSDRAAGDLDVVVVDPDDRLVAVFEVKWQLDPDGAKEIDKAEAQAEVGQAQIRRLSSGLRDGSLEVDWPADWPDVGGWEWQWFVVTSNVIPLTRTSPGEAPARSHLLLTRMALRAGEPLRRVCELLSNPPLPEEGKEFLVQTSTHSLGPYTVSVRRPS